MSAKHGATYVFDNILNFRDVGSTINEFTGRRLLSEGTLYRSARPDNASQGDREALVNAYGIRTIMDLRTKSEHVKQAKRHEADINIPAALQTDNDISKAIEIPGVKYSKININGKGFERTLLWRLSWWNILKLLVLMLFGYRMEAIAILGRNVMLPRGLVGLGYDTLDFCGPELSTALHLLASSSTYPVLVHCTQGKDRTGIIVALLLFLLEVPMDAITFDYTMSETELLPERDERMAEILEIGLSEEFAGTPKDWIVRIHEHLQQKYGGVKSYLQSIGVGKETQQRLLDILQG